jgi:hypothetical protein
MQPSGRIFYEDRFRTQFVTEWATTPSGLLDFTTIVFQPFVWGERDEGYVQNFALYQRGIVTVTRQLIRTVDDGYEIIAHGESQYIDTLRMTHECAEVPKDVFKHHLDAELWSQEEMRVTAGPAWADGDEGCVWSGADGTDGTGEEMSWMSVWSN